MKDFELIVNDKPKEPLNKTGNYWVNYDLPNTVNHWELVHANSEQEAMDNLKLLIPDALPIEAAYYG